MKHFKNLELTAGAILAGLAGSSVASANHSATAHASTVVSKDNAESKDKVTQQDSSKTLSFTTAKAEVSAKNENGGGTSPLKTTDSSDANTSSIEKQKENSNATENKSVKSNDQNTQNLKVQKSAFSVSALDNNKLQNLNTNQSKAIKFTTKEYLNAKSNSDLNDAHLAKDISTDNIRSYITYGTSGNATLKAEDVKKGNEIYLGSYSAKNNLNTELAVRYIGDNNISAISSQYGEIGKIVFKTTTPNHTFDVYLQVTSDKQFTDNVNIAYKDPTTFQVNEISPNIQYRFKGLSKNTPLVESLITPNGSVHKVTYIFPNVVEKQDVISGVRLWNDVDRPNGSFGYAPYFPALPLNTNMTTYLTSPNPAKLSDFHRVLQLTGNNLPKNANGFNDDTMILGYIDMVDANNKITTDTSAVADVRVPKQILSDNLTPQEAFDQTAKDHIGFSKQKDGSWIVCFNVSKEKMGELTSDKSIEDAINSTSIMANLLDPAQKEAMIKNTQAFYKKIGNTPAVTGFQCGIKHIVGADTDFVEHDVTPNSKENLSLAGRLALASGDANATLKCQISYQFIDDDNNGLAVGSPVTLTGKAGDVVNPHLVVPEGYILAEGQALPGDYTLKDSNAPILIHLKHPAKTAYLTVKYVDQDTGKEIPNTEFKQDGHEGDAITYSTADTIKKLQSEGYTVVSDEFTGKAGSKLTAENNGKTYVVTVKKQTPEVKNGKQTINFIEKKTGNTLTTVTVEGKVGSDVTTTLKVPNGYHLIEGQSVPSFVNIKDKNDPINIYVAKDEPVTPVEKDGTQTYNFVDKTTGKVLTTDKVNGKVGKDVSVSLKVPEGYHLVEGETLPTSANIKDKDNPVNIYVEKDKPVTPTEKDGSQTYHFVDKTTGKVITTDKVSGKVGKDVSVSLKVPDGYHLVEGETLPTSVSIKDSDNPVNIYVEKDEAKPSTPETKDGKQTIHIIDKKTGNYLTTVVKGGKIGEDVPVSLKVPAGYHLIKGQKLPTSVNIKDKDNAINVYVEKDEAKPAVTTPSKNNNSKATPAPVENAKAPANIANASVKAPSAPVANNTPAPAQQATLPQTGNSRSTAGIVAGSTLLATMATLGIAYKKRKN